MLTKTSLKVAFKEDRFNLKTISIIFVLIDVFLFPIFLELHILRDFLYLSLYESSIILGLMVGLRGQGRYKAMMLELRSVASNRDLGPDERDARLVPLIHHACLELGISAEMRNEEYGLFKKNFKKKTKNIRRKKKMIKLIVDETVWKQIGYMVVGIWGMFSPVIALFLVELSFHWAIILFLTGSWVFIDVFILFYIHYVFNIESTITATI